MPLDFKTPVCDTEGVIKTALLAVDLGSIQLYLYSPKTIQLSQGALQSPVPLFKTLFKLILIRIQMSLENMVDLCLTCKTAATSERS